jgi:hypothetical protein
MRTFAAVLLTAVLAAPLRAQGPDLDFGDLPIPEGMFELSDVAVFNSVSGGVTATATTTFMNATTSVLVSLAKTTTGQRAFVLALAPKEWSLEETFPALANPALQGLPLTNVGLVITNQTIRASSADLTDDEWEFYRQIYKADEFEIVLLPGVNLIAAIPSEDLLPDNPLVTVMEALGIEKGIILLQGTLGKSLASLTSPGAGGLDIIKDVMIRAQLPPMRPAGSPEWFNSGQLALEITGQPSLRLVGEMNVNVQEDALDFFVAAALARTGMSLSGGLKADSGWVAPFGIDWLTLNKVVLLLGITPTASVQLGFAGDAILGEKDIAVAMALSLSPAGIPTNFLMEGESEAGLALSDLAMVQEGMARAAGRDGPRIPIDALPNIAITDLALKFAPTAQPELGIERGMAIKGRLWIPTGPDGELTDFAGVDVNVGDDGIWVRGDIGAFQLGPLALEATRLDLTATREAQHLFLKGAANLLGTRQALDIAVQRSGLSFRSETRLWDLFSAVIEADAAFNLREPSFSVHAEVQNDFGEVIAPVVTQGLQQFAAAAPDVLAGAQSVLAATDRILADREADVERIRAALTAVRAQAQALVDDAKADVATAQRSLASLRSAADAAERSFNATPAIQVATRVARRAAWTAAEVRYRVQVGVVGGLNAVVTLQQRILDALPPIEQNVLLQGAEAVLAVVRDQAATMRSNIALVEQRADQIMAAVNQGIMPFTVEQATFDASLADLTSGRAVQWSISGTLLGSPVTIQRTLDFSNLVSAAAELVQGLIG